MYTQVRALEHETLFYLLRENLRSNNSYSTEEESCMWLCTSGDSACTFSRKQKTAARTAHQAIKQQPIEASPTLLVECNNQKKKHFCRRVAEKFSLPPLTMKFNRWNTFWVVQPYSGTRSSIRINWICKPQFHEQLKERIWSSTTGSKIQAKANMNSHKFPRPSQRSTHTQLRL
jgi:hypothetical protein